MSTATTNHAGHGTSTKTAAPTWRNFANCLGMDTDMFYPELRGLHQKRAIQRAKNVCDRCLVRSFCEEEASSMPERFGIWGGKTERERGWRRL